MDQVTHNSLPEFSMFRDLPAESLEQLEELAEERRYVPGEFVLRTGDMGSEMFLVVEGQCRVIVPQDGVPFEDTMGPGDVFGEMALLTKEPRTADVVAETHLTCFAVPFDSLRELMTEHPGVAGFLTRVVGERLTRRDGIEEVDEYRVIGPLGRGGFARVFQAEDAAGRPVALKMLRHELVWWGQYARRFRIEASSIQALSHPGIVRVFRVVEAYATLFIAMELIHGSDLQVQLSRRRRFAPEEVREIFRQTALALQHAHDAGVVHRDIKPSNLLLDLRGQVKVLDFGVAQTSEETEIVRANGANSFTGTPRYAAPEHKKGENMDGRTDLFMLGVTCVELLTGGVLKPGGEVRDSLGTAISPEYEDPRALPDMPPDLGELLLRCTRWSPSNRFESCRAAVEFLDAAGERRARVLNVTTGGQDATTPDDAESRSATTKTVVLTPRPGGAPGRWSESQSDDVTTVGPSQPQAMGSEPTPSDLVRRFVDSGFAAAVTEATTVPAPEGPTPGIKRAPAGTKRPGRGDRSEDS